MTFRVKLYRVNEGEHQSSEIGFVATSVASLEDGSLRFETLTGSQVFGPTTWGGFELEREQGSNTIDSGYSELQYLQPKILDLLLDHAIEVGCDVQLLRHDTQASSFRRGNNEAPPLATQSIKQDKWV